ncbi:30S ribosomal protein S15 [Patescibacteria group bacterium]
MAITQRKKSNIIKKQQLHQEDTGSPEVQVALLTEKVKQLTSHLKKHQKDVSSRRGLVKMVNQRRKLLNYLEREDEKRFKKLLKELKIKRPQQST